MKHALALITILVSLASLDLHAAESTYNGRWIQVARICGVGVNSPLKMVPADDAFLNGRDSMKLEIRHDFGWITTRIDGIKSETGAIVDQLEHILMDPNTREKSYFSVGDDGLMIIRSGGFGEGGTCPVGATLFTTLKRY